MKEKNKRGLGVLLISLIIAILLSLMPLPQIVNFLRPNWLLLFVIAWAMLAPHRMGLVSAWLVGLGQDVLYNVPLGVHAMIFAIIAYVILKFQPRINFFSFGHKVMIVFGLILFNYVFEFLLRGWVNIPVNVGFYWWPVLTTLLVWPCAEVFLHHWTEE